MAIIASWRWPPLRRERAHGFANLSSGKNARLAYLLAWVAHRISPAWNGRTWRNISLSMGEK
jgi:hypothetical protein